MKQRVSEGGHNIPDDVLRRRFERGYENFETVYSELVDEWIVYDSSGGRPVRIAEGVVGRTTEGAG